MAWQRNRVGTGSIRGQRRDLRFSKVCEGCGQTYYKYVCTSMKRWETSRFCSIACKGRVHKTEKSLSHKFQPGHTPKHKGVGERIPCRICGDPILKSRGAATCTKPECRKASVAIRSKRIGATLSHQASRRGPGELAMHDFFLALGWVSQHPITVLDGDRERTFYLDFADPRKRLYVEVDGAAHNMFRKPDDRKRDALIALIGWKGIRIWNREAIDRPYDAWAKIANMDRGAKGGGGGWLG